MMPANIQIHKNYLI